MVVVVVVATVVVVVVVVMVVVVVVVVATVVVVVVVVMVLVVVVVVVVVIVVVVVVVVALVVVVVVVLVVVKSPLGFVCLNALVSVIVLRGGYSFVVYVKCGEVNAPTDCVYSSRVVTSSENGLLTYKLYLQVCVINLEGQVFAYLSSRLWSAWDIHLLFYTCLILSFQQTIHLSIFFV